MTPRLETLLVGVDLTAPSLAGADWAVQTFAPDAHVVLAHTIETSPLHSFFSAKDAKVKAEAMRREVAERLEEMRQELGADRAKVVLTDGSPGTRLAELADEEGADLIAVGAHRETFAGGLLGSVVSRLLGCANVPVLIAHGLLEGRPKRALVAIDGSETGKNVLQWTKTLTDSFDLTGQVVYAIEPPGVAVGTTLFSSGEEYERARDQVVARAQAWIRGTAAEAGLDPDRFEPMAPYGRPELEVALAAERMEAELIVIGTRGYTHGRALMLGSVSRRVIEASSCPVLVVPPQGAR